MPLCQKDTEDGNAIVYTTDAAGTDTLFLYTVPRGDKHTLVLKRESPTQYKHRVSSSADGQFTMTWLLLVSTNPGRELIRQIFVAFQM
ncbi:hypothetical protein CHS0354_030909, partial [Potamilus streckersoni]